MAKAKKTVKKVSKPAKKAPAKTKVKAKTAAPAKTKKTAAPKKSKSAKPSKKAAAPALKLVSSHGAAPVKTKKIDFSNLMTPLDDRILVEPVAVSNRTAGGLYIPDTVELARNNRCKVLAVGRGHATKKGKVRPLDVKVGDEILIGPYAGSQISVVGQVLTIVRESEVLGIMK